MPRPPRPRPCRPRRAALAHRARRATLLAALLAATPGCGDGQAATGGGLDYPPSASPAGALVVPEDPGAADVRFTVDATRTRPISPFVYGINALTDGDGAPAWAYPWFGATPPRGVALGRAGGNRWSAYNWENNFSNAGNDYAFSNDGFLSDSRTPGEAVRVRAAASFARGAGILVTVPMLGHVAADGDGSTGADEAGRASRLATRFVVSRPGAGGPIPASPDLGDRAVHQDEFVAWLGRTFPGAAASPDTPLLFSLDNEPDIWHTTHAEVRGPVNGREQLLTYDGFLRTTVEYATAIKRVVPEAVVFGPAVATWAGAATLGRWPSPDPEHGSDFFLDHYLAGLRDAERTAGKRLVDVLDLHWYPAVGTDAGSITSDAAPQTPQMVEARVQAPRSLWDPTYDERSWVSEVQGGPIRLLPLLREKIAAHYPGTRIAISEYYYGRGGDISGGVAQADVLGIFGREGVYAAALWPHADVAAYGGDGGKAYAYVFGAFRMYRDYDGQGGAFGRLGAAATTTDAARSSVYASTDDAATGEARRVVLVAINKTDRPLRAAIMVTDSRRLARAEVYALTAASPLPTRMPDVELAARNALTHVLPPMSVTTLVLRP